MRSRTTLLAIGLAALAMFVPCPSAFCQLLINGAGATFPYPLYSQWFDEYARKNPSINFNYQSIGSGGGIKQITARTVDFGASDAPMTDEQLRAAPGKILHFPTTLGAVVITYNIPNFKGSLRLTGPVIADIYSGKITNWKDAAIAKLNPSITLPDVPILVAHRSDGSGTTYVFTDYLSKVSPGWAKDTGKATAVKWPTGLGGKGNEGVTALVQQTPGAIGYVELIYALQNHLPIADVQNHAGTFVKPSVESVTAAAAGAAASMPSDFRVSITDAPGAASYPISSFTYLLVYAEQDNQQKGKAIKQFLNWMLEDGQKDAAPLAYAPLPRSVIESERSQIHLVKVSG